MSRRVSIELPGFGHSNPIPAASRIGPFVYSGALTGRDPITREMPSGLDEQCANIFSRVHALMDVAGGSTDDIIKMTFWLAEFRNRDALNRQWIAMFPDPADRPARHSVAAQLDGGSLIQCDLVAILNEPTSR